MNSIVEQYNIIANLGSFLWATQLLFSQMWRTRIVLKDYTVWRKNTVIAHILKTFLIDVYELTADSIRM